MLRKYLTTSLLLGLLLLALTACAAPAPLPEEAEAQEQSDSFDLSQLKATPPEEIVLASGKVQLIEMFAYW